MRIAILILAILSGCSSTQRVAPADKPLKERNEIILLILGTVSDNNDRLKLHEDFTEAVDSYLTDVDVILLRTEKRLKAMEKKLKEINSAMTFKRIVADLLKKSKQKR